MGILNAESIPNTVQDEEAMHQSRASHPPPQDATNVAVPAPAPTLRNNQAIEVISTQEDSVDARYKLKRSTKVVAIVGLVTSLVLIPPRVLILIVGWTHRWIQRIGCGYAHCHLLSRNFHYLVFGKLGPSRWFAL
eukprot:TRINITY_DN3586_c0_g1_i2.p2 TRINITY_DN3586_c0_g1~~TRINITY_DN3586_c0_g1_i2.p2  ORF type:complete len:135 (-),score=14.51 TRINITY_DN3586_c0_g1_i2:619-1023(-)